MESHNEHRPGISEEHYLSFVKYLVDVSSRLGNTYGSGFFGSYVEGTKKYDSYDRRTFIDEYVFAHMSFGLTENFDDALNAMSQLGLLRATEICITFGFPEHVKWNDFFTDTIAKKRIANMNPPELESYIKTIDDFLIKLIKYNKHITIKILSEILDTNSRVYKAIEEARVSTATFKSIMFMKAVEVFHDKSPISIDSIKNAFLHFSDENNNALDDLLSIPKSYKNSPDGQLTFVNFLSEAAQKGKSNGNAFKIFHAVINQDSNTTLKRNEPLAEFLKELVQFLNIKDNADIRDIIKTRFESALLKDVFVDVIPEESSDKTTTFIELYSDSDFAEIVELCNNKNKEHLKEFVTLENRNSSQYKTIAPMSLFRDGLNTVRDTFPHFSKVIDNFESHAILQDIGDNIFYLPPFLLTGAPGVGKTFFLSEIAKLVDTTFKVINMQSVTANWVLTGGSTTWSGGSPGIFFETMMKSKTINPIFLLDELDKCDSGKYSTENALLAILERHTAKVFTDENIGLPIDMSYAIFGATSNNLDKISAPIQTRLDVFHVPTPNKDERRNLVKGIYKSTRKDNAWGKKFDEIISEDVTSKMGEIMESGAARNLRRMLVTACANAAKNNRHFLTPDDFPSATNRKTNEWDR